MAASLLLLLFLLRQVSSVNPDPNPNSQASALLNLKNSFTNTSALSSWSNSSANPCDTNSPWAGVVCQHDNLTGINLNGMGLGGTINVNALTHLKNLRSISVSHNALSGLIPPLGRLSGLKSIFLNDNRFHGSISADFFAHLVHLKKLWLSGNSFNGTVPESISKATRLRELHLENNKFFGDLLALTHSSSLVSLNVSNNNFDGVIPLSLSKFNKSSFAGTGLCTEHYGTCYDPSSPVYIPTVDGSTQKTTVICLLLILLACMLPVGLSAARKQREAGELKTLGMVNREVKGATVAIYPRQEERTAASVKAGAGSERRGGAGELTMVNGSKGALRLSELMKTASEMLGSGDLGSAYKAPIGNGATVVVKKMREMNKVGKETFDVEMRRLGRLRHPNVLPPLAYHYGKDEKLMVFEYIPKGSLLYVLHADRGPSHAALDWPTRLKIIRGIASGMAYLHAELNSLDIPHGNLKSGNVLLAHDFEPLLVDYGYISLVNPSRASQTMFAYKSPESLEHRRVSPKSDVYCLGIVILEVLTGKFPSQYLNNTKGGTDVVRWATSAVSLGRESQLLDRQIMVAKSSMPDMERLIRVGAACIEADPNRRPDMKEVAARVEEVAVTARGSVSSVKGEGEEAFSFAHSYSESSNGD